MTSGSRLPEDTHPGRVRLEVASVLRSVAWYRDVLGLVPLEGSFRRAVLGVPGRPLVELRENPGALPVPPGGRLGLFHFALLLPDRPSLGRLVEHLFQRGVAMGASDHGVSEALYLRDPDGLGVEVYADRPREAWEYRQGRLVMGTLPLELEALVQVAGGERWEGAPRRTRMGHIHLHVGDLSRARVFYDDLLGLDATVTEYPGALFLSAGGYHHHLGVNSWAGSGAVAPEAGEARLLDWELVLPTQQGALDVAARLEGAGHPVEREGDPASPRVQDPWGTGLRLTGAKG